MTHIQFDEHISDKDFVLSQYPRATIIKRRALWILKDGATNKYLSVSAITEENVWCTARRIIYYKTLKLLEI